MGFIFLLVVPYPSLPMSLQQHKVAVGQCLCKSSRFTLRVLSPCGHEECQAEGQDLPRSWAPLGHCKGIWWGRALLCQLRLSQCSKQASSKRRRHLPPRVSVLHTRSSASHLFLLFIVSTYWAVLTVVFRHLNYSKHVLKCLSLSLFLTVEKQETFWAYWTNNSLTSNIENRETEREQKLILLSMFNLGFGDGEVFLHSLFWESLPPLHIWAKPKFLT